MSIIVGKGGPGGGGTGGGVSPGGGAIAGASVEFVDAFPSLADAKDGVLYIRNSDLEGRRRETASAGTPASVNISGRGTSTVSDFKGAFTGTNTPASPSAGDLYWKSDETLNTTIGSLAIRIKGRMKVYKLSEEYTNSSFLGVSTTTPAGFDTDGEWWFDRDRLSGNYTGVAFYRSGGSSNFMTIANLRTATGDSTAGWVSREDTGTPVFDTGATTSLAGGMTTAQLLAAITALGGSYDGTRTWYYYNTTSQKIESFTGTPGWTNAKLSDVQASNVLGGSEGWIIDLHETPSGGSETNVGWFLPENLADNNPFNIIGGQFEATTEAEEDAQVIEAIANSTTQNAFRYNSAKNYVGYTTARYRTSPFNGIIEILTNAYTAAVPATYRWEYLQAVEFVASFPAANDAQDDVLYVRKSDGAMRRRNTVITAASLTHTELVNSKYRGETATPGLSGNALGDIIYDTNDTTSFGGKTFTGGIRVRQSAGWSTAFRNLTQVRSALGSSAANYGWIQKFTEGGAVKAKASTTGLDIAGGKFDSEADLISYLQDSSTGYDSSVTYLVCINNDVRVLTAYTAASTTYELQGVGSSTLPTAPAAATTDKDYLLRRESDGDTVWVEYAESGGMSYELLWKAGSNDWSRLTSGSGPFNLNSGKKFSDHDFVLMWLDNSSTDYQLKPAMIPRAFFEFEGRDNSGSSSDNPINFVDWSDNTWAGISRASDTSFRRAGGGMGIRALYGVSFKAIDSSAADSGLTFKDGDTTLATKGTALKITTTGSGPATITGTGAEKTLNIPPPSTADPLNLLISRLGSGLEYVNSLVRAKLDSATMAFKSGAIAVKDGVFAKLSDIQGTEKSYQYDVLSTQVPFNASNIGDALKGTLLVTNNASGAPTRAGQLAVTIADPNSWPSAGTLVLSTFDVRDQDTIPPTYGTRVAADLTSPLYLKPDNLHTGDTNNYVKFTFSGSFTQVGTGAGAYLYANGNFEVVGTVKNPTFGFLVQDVIPSGFRWAVPAAGVHGLGGMAFMPAPAAPNAGSADYQARVTSAGVFSWALQSPGGSPGGQSGTGTSVYDLLWEAGSGVNDRLITQNSDQSLISGKNFGNYNTICFWVDNSHNREGHFVYVPREVWQTLGNTGNLIAYFNDGYCAVQYRSATSFRKTTGPGGIRKVYGLNL